MAAVQQQQWLSPPSQAFDSSGSWPPATFMSSHLTRVDANDSSGSSREAEPLMEVDVERVIKSIDGKTADEFHQLQSQQFPSQNHHYPHQKPEVEYEINENAFISPQQHQFQQARKYNQHKNKKPIHVSINQQTVNGLLSLMLLSVVSVCGCVGGIFIMSALTVIESLQTRGNCFLVSLALGNLLVPLLVVPSSALQIMAGEGINARLLCHYQWLTMEFSLVVSQLSFLLIAADKYLGYKSSEKVTTSTAAALINMTNGAGSSGCIDSQTTQTTGSKRHVASAAAPFPLGGDASSAACVGGGQTALHPTSTHEHHPPHANTFANPSPTLIADGGDANPGSLAAMTANSSGSPATTKQHQASGQQQESSRKHEPLMSKQSPANEAGGTTACLLSLIKGCPEALFGRSTAITLAPTVTLGLLPSGSLQVSPTLVLVPTAKGQRQPPNANKLRLRVAAPPPQQHPGAPFSQMGTETSTTSRLERPGRLSYRGCCGRLKVLVWMLFVWMVALARTLHQHDLSYGPKFCSAPPPALRQLQAHPLTRTFGNSIATSAGSVLKLSAGQAFGVAQQPPLAVYPSVWQASDYFQAVSNESGSGDDGRRLTRRQFSADETELEPGQIASASFSRRRDQLSRTSTAMSISGAGLGEKTQVWFSNNRADQDLKFDSSATTTTIEPEQESRVLSAKAASAGNLLERSMTKRLVGVSANANQAALLLAASRRAMRLDGTRGGYTEGRSGEGDGGPSGSLADDHGDYDVASSGKSVISGSSLADTTLGNLRALQLLRRHHRQALGRNRAPLADWEAQANTPTATERMISGGCLVVHRAPTAKLTQPGRGGSGGTSLAGCIGRGRWLQPGPPDKRPLRRRASAANNNSNDERELYYPVTEYAKAEVAATPASSRSNLGRSLEFDSSGPEAHNGKLSEVGTEQQQFTTATATSESKTGPSATGLSSTTRTTDGLGARVARADSYNTRPEPSSQASGRLKPGDDERAFRYNEKHDYNERETTTATMSPEVRSGCHVCCNRTEAYEAALRLVSEARGNNFTSCDSCHRNKLRRPGGAADDVGGFVRVAGRARLTREYSPKPAMPPQPPPQEHSDRNNNNKAPNSKDDCDSGKLVSAAEATDSASRSRFGHAEKQADCNNSRTRSNKLQGQTSRVPSSMLHLILAGSSKQRRRRQRELAFDNQTAQGTPALAYIKLPLLIKVPVGSASNLRRQMGLLSRLPAASSRLRRQVKEQEASLGGVSRYFAPLRPGQQQQQQEEAQSTTSGPLSAFIEADIGQTFSTLTRSVSRSSRSSLGLMAFVDSIGDIGDDDEDNTLMNNNYHADNTNNNNAVGMQIDDRVQAYSAPATAAQQQTVVGGGGADLSSVHRQLAKEINNKQNESGAGGFRRLASAPSADGIGAQKGRVVERLDNELLMLTATTGNQQAARDRQKSLSFQPAVNQLIINSSTFGRSIVDSGGPASNQHSANFQQQQTVLNSDLDPFPTNPNNAPPKVAAAEADSNQQQHLLSPQDHPTFYWPILLATIIGPSLASIILFARAYVKMKEFKMRPYKPMPLSALNSMAGQKQSLMEHSPLSSTAQQQQIYTFPSATNTAEGAVAPCITTTTSNSSTVVAILAGTTTLANSSSPTTVVAITTSRKCDLDAGAIETTTSGSNLAEQPKVNTNSTGCVTGLAERVADPSASVVAGLLVKQHQKQSKPLPGAGETEPLPARDGAGSHYSQSKFLFEWPIKRDSCGGAERSASHPNGALLLKQPPNSPKEPPVSPGGSYLQQQQQLGKIPLGGGQFQASTATTSSTYDQQLAASATFSWSSPACASPMTAPTLPQLHGHRYHRQVNQVMSAPIGYDHQNFLPQNSQRQPTNSPMEPSSARAAKYGATIRLSLQADEALGYTGNDGGSWTPTRASLMGSSHLAPARAISSSQAHHHHQHRHQHHQEISFSAPPSATFRRDHFSGGEMFAAATTANVANIVPTELLATSQNVGEIEASFGVGSGDQRQQQPPPPPLDSARQHSEFRRRQHHAQSFHYGCSAASRQQQNFQFHNQNHNQQQQDRHQQQSLRIAATKGGSIGNQSQVRRLQLPQPPSFQRQQQLDAELGGFMIQTGQQIDAKTHFGGSPCRALQPGGGDGDELLSQFDSTAAADALERQQQQNYLLWRHRSLPRLYQSETGHPQLAYSTEEQLERQQLRCSSIAAASEGEQVAASSARFADRGLQQNLIANSSGAGTRYDEGLASELSLSTDDDDHDGLDDDREAHQGEQLSLGSGNRAATKAAISRAPSLGNQSVVELMSTALANVIKSIDADSTASPSPSLSQASASQLHSTTAVATTTVIAINTTTATSTTNTDAGCIGSKQRQQLPLLQRPSPTGSDKDSSEQADGGTMLAGTSGNTSTKHQGENKAILCTYYYMTDDQLLKSNIIVFIFNLALWLPFILLSIASQYREHLTQELKDGVWWLATLNCCSCSYVYALTNKDFREAFNKFFYYCCCKSHVTFQRKTPIFRRQLDVDSEGNLRIHIIPGLNVYSNKLSKGGDPHITGGGGIGIAGGHHPHHALGSGGHHHHYYHPLLSAHHHLHHGASSSDEGGHTYPRQSSSLASSALLGFGGDSGPSGQASRGHRISIGGGFDDPLFGSSVGTRSSSSLGAAAAAIHRHHQLDSSYQQRSHYHNHGERSGEQRHFVGGASRPSGGHNRYRSAESSRL